MSLSSDGALGLVALSAFAGALVAVDAPFSIPFFALGAAGTIAFELVAFRRAETVQRYWQRPAVQTATLLLAFAIVGFGVRIAPSSVLSAGVGSLVTYLVVLAAVLATRAHK